MAAVYLDQRIPDARRWGRRDAEPCAEIPAKMRPGIPHRAGDWALLSQIGPLVFTREMALQH
jgi:hypothetical protein